MGDIELARYPGLHLRGSTYYVRKRVPVDLEHIEKREQIRLSLDTSDIHHIWCRYAGGTLQDRPRYNSNRTFFPFPFPTADDARRTAIRDLGQELDTLRRDVLSREDDLTMTGLYNVREKLVRGEPLTDRERDAHDRGCVGIIHELHNRLDQAVAAAYGWTALDDERTVLERLIALNLERQAEERARDVKWLRPEFQIAAGAPVALDAQIEADLQVETSLPELPASPAELASSLLEALRSEGRPVDASALARHYSGRLGKRARDRIEHTLAVLSVAGSVQRTRAGWFAPRRAA
ncbi:MAG TPA: DUF6538 domain-containing protein [Phenylobacterium sp.]|uniref:DUF6538 domain-containing protein n=1 Tax=Phenylobacterium sp. TaxID=1871053 RepID=UPI002C8FAE33|nr:DUF6538 domain-containing protein [Phenylobacterium sp.]HSV01880.1 DUF6538 domain-containing protein [Phenylobacterium sp.]